MELIPWRNKRRSLAPRSAGDAPTSLRDEVDGLFERLFRAPWGTSLSDMMSDVWGGFPRVDMTESEQEIVVRAELPGVKSEDIRVDVVGNVLTLSGEKSARREERRGQCRYSERRYGSFSRALPLPVRVDPDAVDAVHADGVLTVTLRKHPGSEPKRIQVRNA